MKKDKRKNVIIKWLPYGAGAVLLAFIFLLVTTLDKEFAEKVADETLEFSAELCNRYDLYQKEQKNRELTNLQERAETISLYEKHNIGIDIEILEAYVIDETLDGVYVTEPSGKVVAQAGETAPELLEIALQIQRVTDLLQQADAYYTEQLYIGDRYYNLAVIAREKQDGLIFCYHEQAEKGEEDALNMDVMISGYQLRMNATVAITDGQYVLQANRNHIVGRDVSECPITVTDREAWENGEFICLTYKGKHWFGKKMRYKRYVLYAMFPSTEVFYTRTMIMAYGTLLYVFFCMILLFLRNRTAQINMREMQKQFRIIKAISSIYTTTVLIHLDTHRWESIRMPGTVAVALQKVDDAALMLEQYISRFVAESDKERYREFVRLSDMTNRLDGKRYITFVSEDYDGKWSYSLLAPQRWDKDGTIQAVVLAIRDITADKEKERAYQRWAEEHREKQGAES